MRFMHWSWSDYMTAPMDVVNQIVEIIKELNEA